MKSVEQAPVDPALRPAVELVGVSKTYATAGPSVAPAVRSLDLDIRRGEFFTFLGPSGCGKTTTLRMIAGFEAPSEGAILIDGRDVSSLPAHRRNVNTVFQSYALFPHLTIADNVAFGLAVKRVPRPERRDRVQRALELVQMAHAAARKPSALSGGQQQRIALARALVNEPSILLLDEPFGALDLKLRREMQMEVKEMQRRLGITFVFVTHDQEEAMTMSDRIAVMSEGRIRQVDDPAGIYERPADRFTAGFIGDMNILAATIRRLPDGTATAEAGGVVIDLPAQPTVPLGTTAALGIRPEALSIVDREIPGRTFRGRVVDSVYVGAERRHRLSLSTGDDLVVRVPNSLDAKARPVALGDELLLAFQPSAVRILPD